MALCRRGPEVAAKESAEPGAGAQERPYEHAGLGPTDPAYWEKRSAAVGGAATRIMIWHCRCCGVRMTLCQSSMQISGSDSFLGQV